MVHEGGEFILPIRSSRWNRVDQSIFYALAKELLDDIELSRLPAESLLLKSSRLARWVGSDEIKYWISLEMQGYNTTNETSLKYMGLTGIWVNRDEKKGYWGPLAQQEAALAAQNIKLKSLTTPDTSGDWVYRIMRYAI
jgi:hypothetical protein